MHTHYIGVVRQWLLQVDEGLYEDLVRHLIRDILRPSQPPQQHTRTRKHARTHTHTHARTHTHAHTVSLLVLTAAAKIDQHGDAKHARKEIAMIKAHACTACE